MDIPEDASGDDFVNSSADFDFHDPNIIHDRILIVEGQKFYVQSGLLSVCSEYFRIMFTQDFVEKNQHETEIKEVSAKDFETFLQLIYPDLFELNFSHIEPLINLSFFLLAPKVVNICLNFIDEKFAELDKMKLYTIGANASLRHLQIKSLMYIVKNIENLNQMDLLKFAFTHNLEHLKKNLRSYIYTYKQEARLFKCFKCNDGTLRSRCQHHSNFGVNGFLIAHIDDILKLPEEIKDFVLSSVTSDL